MLLKLRHLTFSVEICEIAGGIWDPYWLRTYHPTGPTGVTWGMFLRCHPLSFEDDTWQPVLHYDTQLPIRSWINLAGLRLNWNSPFSETGEPNGSFYIYEHLDILDAELKIGVRKKNTFPITWSGHCDILAKPPFDRAVPFEITAAATFKEIVVHSSERETAPQVLERISKILDVDTFTVGPFEIQQHSYESKVKMAQIILKPK